MATRSVIGVRNGDTIEGRYCHFDGYPEHMYPTLCAIVDRDGPATAIETIMSATRGGWSSLAYDAEENTAFNHKFVEGYGDQYTDMEENPSPTIVRFGSKFSDDMDKMGAEYAYTIDAETGDVTCYEADGQVLRPHID